MQKQSQSLNIFVAKPKRLTGLKTHTALFSASLLMVLCLACHRTEFDADQTTVCPAPEGNLVILEYTLNCLYVGDQPDTGCPESAPYDYVFRDTFICSERTRASETFLQAVIDRFLDIDAAIVDAFISDMAVPFSDLTSMVDGGEDPEPSNLDAGDTSSGASAADVNCLTTDASVCDDPEDGPENDIPPTPSEP